MTYYLKSSCRYHWHLGWWWCLSSERMFILRPAQFKFHWSSQASQWERTWAESAWMGVSTWLSHSHPEAATLKSQLKYKWGWPRLPPWVGFGLWLLFPLPRCSAQTSVSFFTCFLWASQCLTTRFLKGFLGPVPSSCSTCPQEDLVMLFFSITESKRSPLKMFYVSNVSTYLICKMVMIMIMIVIISTYSFSINIKQDKGCQQQSPLTIQGDQLQGPLVFAYNLTTSSRIL